jgi:ketosteroid isomerase-like protein
VSTEVNRAAIQRFLDAIENGDGEALHDLLAPDATWTVPGEVLNGTHEGRDAIFSDFLGPGGALFEPGSMTMTIRSLLVDGDKADAEWNTKARTARGDEYDNNYNIMFELRDGKIVAVREYSDTGYAKRKLMPD